MSMKRLTVLALAVIIFVGCGTIDEVRAPNQDQSQEFVKEKRAWDSPGL